MNEKNKYIMMVSNDREDWMERFPTEEEAIRRAKDEQYYIKRDNRKGDKVSVYEELREDDDWIDANYREIAL